MMRIVLYSTHCPKCVILEKRLKENNIKYEEVNDVDIMIELEFYQMPMLKVDDTVMNFKDAINWINQLK